MTERPIQPHYFLTVLVLIQTVAYNAIGSQFVRFLVCLSFLFLYLVLLPRDHFFQLGIVFRFITRQKLNLLTRPVLQNVALKKIWAPAWFIVLSCLCITLLTIGSLLGTSISPRNYGLYLPIIFLWVGHFFCVVPSRFFLKKTNHIFLKIYRRYPESLKILLLFGYGACFITACLSWCLAFRSSLSYEWWNEFGFYDKRFVYGCYLLLTVVFLFFPFFLYAFKNRAPYYGRIIPDQALSHYISLKILIGLGITFILWGPPWNLTYVLNIPDLHEVVHLGPILAMKQGKIAFTEAEIQYGPGSQLFHYLYMKSQGFNLLAFRESCIFLHTLFVAFFIGCCAFYLRLSEVCLVFLLSLSGLTPLLLFGFDNQGLSFGFWGWFNGFRYCSPVFLSLVLWHVLYRSSWKKFHTAMAGLIHGILCYMAQENFSCGLLVLGLSCMVSLSIGLLNLRTLFMLAAWFLGGFIVAWLPVCIFYGLVGQWGLFVERYFAVSSLVVAGFSNTPWSSHYYNPFFLGYALTPFVLTAVGVFILYRRRFRTYLALTPEEVKIIFVLSAAIALHQISLFRADDTHFRATLLALPVLLVLVGQYLYRLFSSCPQEYGKMFLGFCLSLLVIYPIDLSFSHLGCLLEGSMKKYTVQKLLPSEPMILFDKIGFPLPAEKVCCTYSTLTLSDYVREMTSLKDLIGDRPTIVVSMPGNITSGVYFFADLKIGTSMIESYHSLVHSPDRIRLLQQIQKNPCGCLIVENLESEEAHLFLKRFPKARIIKRFYQGVYYILLMD